jgi:hypothetical protein
MAAAADILRQILAPIGDDLVGPPNSGRCALHCWQDVACITEGAVFGRIWRPPTRRTRGESPLPVGGHAAIDAGTV